MSTVEIIAEDDIIVVAQEDNVAVTIETGEQGPPGIQGPPGQASTVPGPPGPPGSAGTSILYGISNPTPTTGHDGDFYINTATSFLFGPKAGGWPAGTSLIGPQGTSILYGTVNPIATVGRDGDFYINTMTSFLFGPKVAGAWPAGTSLIGPQGIPGIGVATVTVSDTPPAGAPDATLWWESSTGLLYVFYNDGSSRQWVVAAPQPDISTFVQKHGDTLTGPLILNADPTNPLGAATKQYVDANAGTGGGGSAPPVSNSNPIMDGVAAPGSLTGYSRGDHVHPSDTSRVAKSGDTMTGALAVTNGVTVAAAAWPSLTLNRTAAGGGSIITGQMAGVARWDMRLGDQDAESGGNAGSSFLIYRYNDAGSPVDAPLSINRASGLVSVNNLAVNAVGIGFRLIASQYGVLFDNDDNNFYILLTNQYDPNGSLNGLRPFSIALNSGAVSCANGLSCNTLNVTSNASVGGQMQVNSGVLSVGYRCRAGTGGGYGGNNYNLNWVVGTGMNVWVDTSNLGTIFFSSDYRIKKDVGDLPGMWAKVKALRPIKYTQAEFSPPSHLAHIEQMKAKGNEVSDAPLFAADNIERWGFVAHELQATLTGTAASGVKDAPDTIQAPNPLTVIAALTKALQEAMTRIEVLEARAGAR